jgi:4-amino-4-deoxy-L-arabinose transferase-like glycosyltransferase
VWPVAGVAVAAFALRLAWPAGLDLYGDEAYYALWSRQLALGYFDHPPLVAWLLRAASLLGQSEIWLRLPFAACGGLAVFFSAGIARELSPDSSRTDRAPLLAAFLTAVAPVAVITSALALPDAPLAAAVAGCTWLVLRARRGDLLWAGVLFGLALLSKYSAATLVPGFALIALRDPEARGWLRGREAWIAIAIAAALFAPCLYWNARHDFVSLGFQIHHASGGGFAPQTLMAFAGTELLGAGPLTLLLALPFLWRAGTTAARRLAALTLLPLLWFAFAALRGRFEANWPAFLDPALCAAAAAALSTLPSKLRRASSVAASAAAVAAVIVLGLELRHPRFVPATNVEVARFHDGKALADAVRARLNGTRPFFFTNDYQDAGELAFYGGYARFGPCLERPSQLDVWGDLPAASEPFVFLGTGADRDALRAHFPGARELHTEAFPLSLDGTVMRTASLTWFQNFHGFVR